MDLDQATNHAALNLTRAGSVFAVPIWRFISDLSVDNKSTSSPKQTDSISLSQAIQSIHPTKMAVPAFSEYVVSAQTSTPVSGRLMVFKELFTSCAPSNFYLLDHC
jgi:hypothetical protein